jgi:hypothetical protein
MLLFHPIYQGKRESRVRRENPFAFVVRSELAFTSGHNPAVAGDRCRGTTDLLASQRCARVVRWKLWTSIRHEQAEPRKAAVSVGQIIITRYAKNKVLSRG